MSEKIKLGDIEYDVEDLTDQGKVTLAALEFTAKRLKELENMKMLLNRAKNSYLKGLKAEILSNKAGFHFHEE